MLITIGALFLLNMVILNVNRGLYWTNSTMSDNRVGILAVSVGTSVMEKASSLAFDEKTVGGSVLKPSDCTSNGSLGLETGEYSSDINTFDDFDDFKCFTASNPKVDEIVLTDVNKKIVFKTICKVSYVRGSFPDQDTTSQSWYKKLRVFVVSNDMTDTVKLSTIYSFWYITKI